MSESDKYAIANISFKFSSTSTTTATSSQVPQLRGGYSSSKSVVVPKYLSDNHCLTLFHSYGEAPAQVFHSGSGSMTYSSGGTEIFEDFVSVSGSNKVTLSGSPKGGVSFSDINLTLIKEETIAGKTKFVGSSGSPTMSYNPETGEVTLSSSVNDKFYGSFTATYSAIKTLYIVDLSGEICPETVAGAKDKSNPSFTITALFSKGASSSNGTRDSQCCTDKRKKDDRNKQQEHGNIVSQPISGRSDGCIKLLHLYGSSASNIAIIKGPIDSISDYGEYSEVCQETLVFNGSTSVSLAHPAQGNVTILEKSAFKGSGYYAVYAPEDTDYKNPSKGEFSDSIGSPSLSFNPDSNAVEAAKDMWIVEPKYYGAIVVEYTTKRYDYLVSFTQEWCPENEDSPEDRKLKEEKARGLLLVDYLNGGMSTVSIDRDSSCCPERKKEGYATESYTVPCEAISVKERFYSHYTSVGDTGAEVLEYVLVQGYGHLDFTVTAFSIKSGVMGSSSGGDLKNIDITATKVYLGSQVFTETVPLTSASSGNLKLIPIDPTWSPIGPLTPDVPIDGGGEGLSIVFGSSRRMVYDGEYDGYKRSFRITGTKYLKPNEFAVVDRNGVTVSATGTIKVSYLLKYAIYEMKYKVENQYFKDPTHNVKYLFSYANGYTFVTGDTMSDLSLNNKVSKKEVRYLKDLLGQAK